MSRIKNVSKTQETINEIQNKIIQLMAENEITNEEWNKEWINMFKVPEKK